jgi:hypothetical protein
MATGSVVVELPLDDVEEEFARAMGADGSTVVHRDPDGDFHASTRVGLGRVLQRFTLEPQGDAATAVHAAVWVRPAPLGWVLRRVVGRRRIADGVQAALERMARAATGQPEPEPEPEFGPADFRDDTPDD